MPECPLPRRNQPEVNATAPLEHARIPHRGEPSRRALEPARAPVHSGGRARAGARALHCPGLRTGSVSAKVSSFPPATAPRSMQLAGASCRPAPFLPRFEGLPEESWISSAAVPCSARRARGPPVPRTRVGRRRSPFPRRLRPGFTRRRRIPDPGPGRSRLRGGLRRGASPALRSAGMMVRLGTRSSRLALWQAQQGGGAPPGPRRRVRHRADRNPRGRHPRPPPAGNRG